MSIAENVLQVNVDILTTNCNDCFYVMHTVHVQCKQPEHYLLLLDAGAGQALTSL